MAAVPVESCQSVVPRSPWGRQGRYYTLLVTYTAYAAASSIFRPILSSKDSFANVAGGAFWEARGYVPGPLL